jgi:hypothetical protein
MMYKAESDSTITNKEIKKAIFDLKKGKSAGPDRILKEVIKYTNLYFIMILKFYLGQLIFLFSNQILLS